MSFFDTTFTYLDNRQREFLANKGNTNPARVAKTWNWIDRSIDFIGHLQEELIEVKRELPHKWWKELFTPNTDAVLSELADVYIHWVNLCNALGSGLGFTYSDVKQAISEKINFNNERPDQAVKGLSEKLGLEIQADLVILPFSQEQLKILVSALESYQVTLAYDETDSSDYDRSEINFKLCELFKSQLDD